MPISSSAPPATLKFLTWNILNEFHTDRLRQVYLKIKEESPDIVLLQEFITAYESEELDFSLEEAVSNLETLTGMIAVPAIPEAKHPKKNLSFGNVTLYNPERLRCTSARYPNDKDLFKAATSGVSLAVFDDLVTGRPILVANAHLSHGGQRTFSRYMQVVQINNYTDQFVKLLKNTTNLEPVVIFGGDFNMLPDADPIRFLKGLTIPEFLVKPDQVDETYYSYGTYWVDAWEYLRPTEPGYTSKNYGDCAIKTAVSVGVDALKMPPRRIDYFFVHGWVYGKPGTPLNIDVLESTDGDLDLSDHHGLVMQVQL